MANRFYALGAEWVGQNGLTALTSLRLALCDVSYTPNFTTDEFLDDITGVVATTADITNPVFTLGVFDADDPAQLTGVTGNAITQGVLYDHTGTAGTSHLIAYIDTATGLPLPASPLIVNIAWNASGILKIVP